MPRPARELLGALPFLAPSIVLFGAFVFYPLVKSVYLGFFVSNPFRTRQIYVGFDQYVDVLTSSSFISSLLVTGTFTLYTVVPALAIATFLAILANQKLPGMIIFRTIFASPLAASVAISAVLWRVLLDPNIGVLNEFLGQVGLSEVNWLQDGGWAVGERADLLDLVGAWFIDPNWALISVSLATGWMNIGLFTIIILAGLQTIPEELYESARVDGAGRWGEFWHVTLPMLSPTLFFASIIGVIFAFQAFGQIQILTQGGPVDATNVLLYSIYQEAFEAPFRVGSASVQAIALFVILLVLTLIQFRLFSRRVFYR
ncbi:MAG: sugar ABC transporter permease [Chloroflexi bacterium]|nr:sugar ABC transporter permease [Chloroflexota bacterium]